MVHEAHHSADSQHAEDLRTGTVKAHGSASRFYLLVPVKQYPDPRAVHELCPGKVEDQLCNVILRQKQICLISQIPAVMIFLLVLDYTMGWIGWSLEYGLPIVLLGLLVLIIVCMCINHKNWQIYMVLQLFTLLFSVIDLWLVLSGVVKYQVLPLISLGVSVALFLGTLLIGDRKAMNELKRKFHV